MKQFKLRIPDELHECLAQAAETNENSVTTEILERLRESFIRESMLNDLRRVLAECNKPLTTRDKPLTTDQNSYRNFPNYGHST